VALGSTVSRILTQPDLNLSRGLLSLAVLFGVEWLTTLLISYNHTWAHVMRAQPALLVFRGEICYEVVRAHRLSDLGIMQALRCAGVASLDDVETLCLEGNGTFSCIKRLDADASRDTLAYIPDYKRALEELGEEPPHKTRAPRGDHFLRNAITPANLQRRQRSSSQHVSGPKENANGHDRGPSAESV